MSREEGQRTGDEKHVVRFLPEEAERQQRVAQQSADKAPENQPRVITRTADADALHCQQHEAGRGQRLEDHAPDAPAAVGLHDEYGFQKRSGGHQQDQQHGQFLSFFLCAG